MACWVSLKIKNDTKCLGTLYRRQLDSIITLRLSPLPQQLIFHYIQS